MRVIVVAEHEPGGALSAALAELGCESTLHHVESTTGPQSRRALAEALTALERLTEELAPGLIVAVGPGDGAVAAALVAGKAEIAFALVADSPELDDELRATAQLSSMRFDLPRDGIAVAQVAEAIVTGARRAPA